MYAGVIFLCPGQRRPVWLGSYRDPDVQGRLPRWWCSRCGREVFTEHSLLCDRCREVCS